MVSPAPRRLERGRIKNADDSQDGRRESRAIWSTLSNVARRMSSVPVGVTMRTRVLRGRSTVMSLPYCRAAPRRANAQPLDSIAFFCRFLHRSSLPQSIIRSLLNRARHPPSGRRRHPQPHVGEASTRALRPHADLRAAPSTHTPQQPSPSYVRPQPYQRRIRFHCLPAV